MLYKHCRICLTKTFKFSCFSNGENSIKYKLRLCAPEIDLNIISDPVLCESCTRKLDVAYSFKLQCLNMEDQIIKYIKTMQPETLHIQMLDVIRMSIGDPKRMSASNASVIELSDAEDDSAERNASDPIPIIEGTVSDINTNILDQSIETIHLNQVTTTIPVVCITPVTEPIIVENASKEETMEIDAQITNKANRQDSSTNGRKYSDVFQKRISNYVEQNLLAKETNNTNAKCFVDSDIEVVIVDDIPQASTTQGNKQNISRSDKQNPQQSNTVSVSKENVQQNTSKYSYTDRNKSKQIKGHVMKDGAIIKKPFGCTKCSETFETIDRLLKHVREHKSSTVTNYTKNCRVTTSKNS